MHRMNPRKTTLAIIAMLSVSVALGDDIKTTNGKEYKDAKVTRVEPDGIVLLTKSGISKVYFNELPKELQDRFHYQQPAGRCILCPTERRTSGNSKATGRGYAADCREEAEKQRQSAGAQQAAQIPSGPLRRPSATRAEPTGRNRAGQTTGPKNLQWARISYSIPPAKIPTRHNSLRWKISCTMFVTKKTR